MLSRTVLTFSSSQWEANKLFISKTNEVYMKIDAEHVIKQELSDYFTFNVPNAKFTPAFRNRIWDGKIRLFNLNTKQLYIGLLPYVKSFCEERDYSIELKNDLINADSFNFNAPSINS